MIQFAWVWVSLVLPLPYLIRVVASRAEKRYSALKVPFYREIDGIYQKQSHRHVNSRSKLALFTVAWIMLVIAAMRPQWVGEPVALPLKGRDIMLAVDLSLSMKRPDLKLNGHEATRLDVIKSVAGDFIQRRKGDRIGLILFGKRAYIQTPLTFDRTTVRTMLDEAEIGLAGKETAIGDAIGLAIKRLRERPREDRILILLTDGANTAGEVDPSKAADLAATEGLKIYTIGIGADAMKVRGFFGSQTINPSSDLDEGKLKYIASKTGGRYFRAKNTRGLEKIYRRLDELEPYAKEDEIFRPVDELYQWPLGIVVVLSFFYALWLALPVMGGVLLRGRSNES